MSYFLYFFKIWVYDRRQGGKNMKKIYYLLAISLAFALILTIGLFGFGLEFNSEQTLVNFWGVLSIILSTFLMILYVKIAKSFIKNS